MSTDNSIPTCGTCGTRMLLSFYDRGPGDPPGNSWICPNGCSLTYSVELKQKSTRDIMLDLVMRVVLLEMQVKKLEEEIDKK